MDDSYIRNSYPQWGVTHVPRAHFRRITERGDLGYSIPAVQVPSGPNVDFDDVRELAYGDDVAATEVMVAFSDAATGRKWAVTVGMFKVLGRLEIGEVKLRSLDSKGVTAASIREVPWGSIIADARADLADAFGKLAALEEATVGEQVMGTNIARKLRDVDRRGRGRKISDADLRKAAEVYRRHALGGRAPTDAVARELGLTRSTAGKWIMRARRMGLLGAAEPGKAGEHPTEDNSEETK